MVVWFLVLLYMYMHAGLLCNRDICGPMLFIYQYVCMMMVHFPPPLSPSPACCSAVTQLVLNDTNAQHVVQVSDW